LSTDPSFQTAILMAPGGLSSYLLVGHKQRTWDEISSRDGSDTRHHRA
jgi:hypothetical protein